MATINTDEGRNWFASKILGEDPQSVIYEIAVGDGQESLSRHNKNLSNQLYRGDADDSIITFTNTATIGEFTADIRISGGTEVPSNSEIREFGIFARNPSGGDDSMIYRELKPVDIITSGERKTYRIPYSIQVADNNPDAVIPDEGREWIVSSALGEASVENEKLFSVALGQNRRSSTITYQTGVAQYAVDDALSDDGILTVTDANGNTYTEGVDYDEADTNADGNINGIEWLSGGTSPTDGTNFTVDYKIDMAASTSDTQLDEEVGRWEVVDTNVSVEKKSSVGRISVSVSVTGGTEVPSNTSIAEIGVFARDPSISDTAVTDADDTLIYKEPVVPIILGSGDTKTFSTNIDILG